MTHYHYKKNLLLIPNKSPFFIASDIEDEDIVMLSGGTFFWAFDVEKEFKNDKVAKLYEDTDKEILPKHEKISLYDELGSEVIVGIPGDTPVVIYRELIKEV